MPGLHPSRQFVNPENSWAQTKEMSEQMSEEEEPRGCYIPVLLGVPGQKGARSPLCGLGPGAP